MVHLCTSSPPLECESLPLVVQYVYWTKVSGLEDKWELNPASTVLVSSCVFAWGHVSSEVEAPFWNLHKTSSCASKALCTCIWWMHKCLLFRWATPLPYLNVIIQKGGITSIFNSLFIISYKIQEANMSRKAQAELWKGNISALPGYSLNFHYY